MATARYPAVAYYSIAGKDLIYDNRGKATRRRFVVGMRRMTTLVFGQRDKVQRQRYLMFLPCAHVLWLTRPQRNTHDFTAQDAYYWEANDQLKLKSSLRFYQG